MTVNYRDLPFVWSELMSRLTGTDAAYDLEVIKGFAVAFDIPVEHVVARIRTHLHRSLVLQ